MVTPQDQAGVCYSGVSMTEVSPSCDRFPAILDSIRAVWYPAFVTPKLLAQRSSAARLLPLAEMAPDVAVSNQSSQKRAATVQAKISRHLPR